MKTISYTVQSLIKGLFLLILLLPLSIMIHAQSGNVGIGNPNPTEKLDVDGNIKLTGEIKPDGNSGIHGQVLQSDGDGSMGWTDANILGGSVGYGSWGNCEMAALAEYCPVSDPEGEGGDNIGHSVDISVDYAVIGAHLDDGMFGADEGSVSVFTRDPATGLWVIDGNKIYGSNTQSGDQFGNSVSIDGIYMAIGAHMENVTYTKQGTLSIYKRNSSDGLWQIQGFKLTNPGASANEYFGHCVDISGDYVITGTPYDDYISGNNHGSACIFSRNPSTGEWGLDVPKFLDPSPEAEAKFGHSVAISGLNAVVGSPMNDGITYSDAGSVSFYRKDTVSGDWNLQGPKVYSPSPGISYQFGYSVDIDGDYAVVGVPHDGSEGTASAGAAYVFKRNEISGDWEPFGVKLLNPEMEVNDKFGYSVSISGNYVLVGCQMDDGYGSATLFVNIGPSFQGMQKITDPWGNAGDYFGYCLGIESSTQRFIIGAYGAFAYMGKAVFGKY